MKTISQNAFNKDDTLVLKGIAVILMLDHHVFLDKERYGGYGVQFYPLSEYLTVFIAKYGKVCVGMFAFITAYGLTLYYRSMMERGQFENKAVGRSVMQRITRLLGSFWIAYGITVLGSCYLVPERLEVYGEGLRAVFYAVVDILGLAHMMGTPTFLPTWWYVSLAIVNIVFIPLLLRLYDKIGPLFMTGLCILVPRVLGIELVDLNLWTLMVVWGIWFADQNLFQKLKDWKPFKAPVLGQGVKFLLLFFLTAMTAYYRNDYGIRAMRDLTNCTATLLFLCFCYLYVVRIPILRQVLAFIGKYSMNMYFLHNSLFMLWFKEEFYSLGNCWVILGAVVGASLLLSFVIEKAKKLFRYNKLIDKIAGIW